MSLNTQEHFWSGDFGKNYTDRNSRHSDEFNNAYEVWYGISRTKMNQTFLGSIPKDIKILEVGCNTGMQLSELQSEGFTSLYGIELQDYAVQKAKEYTEGINIIQGSAFDIPFKDNFFDLVFTSGVLIHISPDNLSKVFSEMYRCSKKYVWGFEYYSDDVTSINYRGNEGFLWKANYGKLLRSQFSNLELIKEEKYPYITQAEKGNVDFMYLLEKRNA
ncbi:MAG: methyltransferase domain-containing protein [Cyclobacteriaceae bacterium]|nr:methyltransferase domain-containing protein [Cyclobacteriaceae bacterium]